MRLIYMASAALTCLTTAALAFTNSGPSDSYTGLRGAIYFDGSISGHAATTPPTQVKADTGTGGGASYFIGWNLADGFRTELELLYRSQSLATATMGGVSGKIGGHSQTFAPMANAYWDIPVGDFAFKPFIGAGLGYGWNETSVRSIAGSSFPTAHNDRWGLVYNAMAGISIPTSDSSRLTAMYRWLHQDIGVNCGTGLSCSAGFNASSIDLGFELDL